MLRTRRSRNRSALLLACRWKRCCFQHGQSPGNGFARQRRTSWRWILTPLDGINEAQPLAVASQFPAATDLVAARIYATSLGLYEEPAPMASIVDAVLTPGWTSYHHRLQCQTWRGRTDTRGRGMRWVRFWATAVSRLSGTSSQEHLRQSGWRFCNYLTYYPMAG